MDRRCAGRGDEWAFVPLDRARDRARQPDGEMARRVLARVSATPAHARPVAIAEDARGAPAPAGRGGSVAARRHGADGVMSSTLAAGESHGQIGARQGRAQYDGVLPARARLRLLDRHAAGECRIARLIA